MSKPSTLTRNAHIGLAIGLALVLFLLYGASVWDHGYIYDDYRLIETNPRLLGVLDPLRYWDTPLWTFNNPIEGPPTGFWRPFTLQVLAIAHWASDGAAWGPHLASLLLHFGASLAAVALARRIGLRAGWAYCVGLLFALHPAQVQSVAWASSINDPLIGLFSLLALTWFLAWVQEGKRSCLVGACVMFALGLLSKEQAAATLPLAFGLAWWKGDKGLVPALVKALPFAGVLLAYYLVRVHVFDAWHAGLGGAVVDFQLERHPGRAWQFPFELLGGFASTMLWPVDLAFFRGVRPVHPEGSMQLPLYLGLAFTWLACIAASLWWRRWSVAALLAMPLVWLAPQVIMYESAGAYPHSDRYLYVPLFGFIALCVWGLSRASKPILPAAVVALGAIAYGTLSHSELGSYSDDQTFFKASIEESPEVPVSYWSLGRELLDEYKRTQDFDTLNEALFNYLTCLILGRDYGERAPKLPRTAPVRDRIRELEALIHGSKIRPPLGDHQIVSGEDLFQANMGQGWVFTAMGELPPDYDRAPAIQVFRQITEAFPHRYEGWIGLGSVLESAGDLEGARKAIAESIAAHRENPQAWYLMGGILRRQGDFGGAAGAFQEAARFRPWATIDSIARIESFLDGEQPEMAEQEIQAFKEKHGPTADFLYLDGMLAAQRSQWEKALNSFDRVLAKEPLNVNVNLQRAKVLIRMARTNDAIASLGKVCELDSSNFEAHSLIGEVLLTNPASEEQAREYLTRAYQLGQPGPSRLRVQSRLVQWVADDESALMAYMLMDEGRGDYVATLRWIEQLLLVKNPWARAPDRQARMAAVQLSAGNALKALGENARALASYRESIELSEGIFWPHYQLGTLLLNLSRPNEALPPLERAMELIEQVSQDNGLQRAVRTDLQAQINHAKATGPNLVGPPLNPDKEEGQRSAEEGGRD